MFWKLIYVSNHATELELQVIPRTSNDSSEEEPEAPRLRDTVAEERASEEYKEKGRSTSRNEDYLGHERSPKMKKSMTRLPKKLRCLGHTPVM